MKRHFRKAVGSLLAVLTLASVASAAETTYDGLYAQAMAFGEQARTVVYACSHEEMLEAVQQDTRQMANDILLDIDLFTGNISTEAELSGRDLKNLRSLTDQTLSALEKSGCLGS